ncbi:hypothetical protein [Salipiger aestuarii]|uniref:Uncharacterized protein n=1 Tax=Salipiger aestuarii TaxID=568098 RepID=A0A327Y4C4_9RHOB|nr:hypothetical protein [Salipiger aestuarii]EIE49700.1 hypothetical protein C357_17550 [Citreicella sp. 357]RAK15152.1 hypothetical protein ATI53_102554 [Salipiger aestuarii]
MRHKTRLKALTALQAAALAMLAIFGAFTAQGHAKSCKPNLSPPSSASCYIAPVEAH